MRVCICVHVQVVLELLMPSAGRVAILTLGGCCVRRRPQWAQSAGTWTERATTSLRLLHLLLLLLLLNGLPAAHVAKESPLARRIQHIDTLYDGCSIVSRMKTGTVVGSERSKQTEYRDDTWMTTLQFAPECLTRLPRVRRSELRWLSQVALS